MEDLETILAIHAHPDDVEMLCAGTLALLSAAGHRIAIVTMTPGDCGSHEHGAEEIARIRRREAARAAAHIGAEYRCAEFRDLAIFSDDASRRRVTEILRVARPSIILTAPPVDYMCDHEATSQLVRDACFGAPAPNYHIGAEPGSEPGAAPLPAIPHLYFMSPLGGTEADFYVDIGGTFAVKRAMLAEHESQRSWLAKHHGMDDYLAQMERWTRANGQRAGVEFAEGFRQYRGHPYPETPLLQDLLRGYCTFTSTLPIGP
jgi:LmbE family N-acetylglucosaminyl deacetylase